MLEIAIALTSHWDTVFASGFPADGIKWRGSGVPFKLRYDATRGGYLGPVPRPSVIGKTKQRSNVIAALPSNEPPRLS